MQTIITNHLVNYQDQGKGPVIVLLHGWGASLDNMSELTAALAKQYRVISFDFPGFGASEHPGAAWGVREYTEFTRDVLEKLGVHDVYAVIGHSFGGRVIIKGVSEGILLPQKVVLIGSAGVKHADSLKNTTYKVVAKTGKALLRIPGLKKLAAPAKRKLYESAGSSDYIQSGAMKDIFIKTITEDLSDDARKLSMPVLLIWGGQDVEAPVADGRFFHSVMKQSEMHIIPDAGHFVHNEYPKEVAAWVEEFLA